MKYHKEFNIGNLLCAKNHDTLKWGLFNPDLEIVIPFEYDKIWPGFFSDNKNHYLVAIKDKMVGLINIDTKEVIPQKPYTLKEWEYPDISLIKEKDGKFGIVDAYGNFVVQPIYDKIEYWQHHTKDCDTPNEHNESLYLVELNGKYGIVSDSNILKEPVFDYIAENSYGTLSFYEASKNGKFGYINELGDTIIDFTYLSVGYPDSLYITTAKTFDGHVHFINLKTQKVIYDMEFNDLSAFTIERNHIGILTKQDNMCYIVDKNGKILSKFKNPKETDEMLFEYFNDALLASVENESWVLCDMQGKILEFSKKYRLFTPLSGTTNFIAHLDYPKEELLDKDGNVLLPNMKNAYCIGDDEDGVCCPPVIYYTDDNEEKITDISITPYEIPVNDSDTEESVTTSDTSINIGDILQDNEVVELINSDKQHYAYIISEKSIRVIDNKGKTTKEIAFNIEEGDADEDFEPEDYLE